MHKSVTLLALMAFGLSIFAQPPQPFEDEKTGKYGYKDASGKIVIKPVYDIAHEFTEGLYTTVNIGADYSANKGGKWGVIDSKGKIIIPLKYDNAHCLGYNLFAINTGHKFSNMDASPSGKFAIFNSAGKALTPFIYSGFLIAVRFEEGYAPLEIWDARSKKQKYGLLDSTGKVAVPAKYDVVGGFREGRCLLELNGKCGYIDKSVKQVIPLKYEAGRGFFEGLAPVQLNGKWGYIDPAGKEAIAFQYEDAKNFEEGYAAVKRNGKWGVINKEARQVVDFIYEDIVWIKKDAREIRVRKGNRYVNVDREGNELK